MKKLITIVMLLLVVITCKKDNKSNSSVNNEITTKNNEKDTFLTATINGKEFSSSVEVVTFRANNQMYLTTVDNSDSSEFAFNLIIKNDKDNDPKKLRYGFLEKEDEKGNNKTWKLPNNFDFTSTITESGNYLEGTFSFVANSFAKGVEDRNDQLEVTNGKFKAKKPNH